MDVIYPCKNALVSFLCTLIDEQVFHLKNSQSVGQDKILSCRGLSFQILFFRHSTASKSSLRVPMMFKSSTYTAIITNSDPDRLIKMHE